MGLMQTLEAVEALSSAAASGQSVVELMTRCGGRGQVEVTTVGGRGGCSTDFVRVVIPGARGKMCGGNAPTIGVIGRLGGIGARPARIGLVSDADGAIAAVSVAMTLSAMAARGDRLAGDVVVSTHVCPNAPVESHTPVDFMGSPVNMATLNSHEVSADMDGILSIDTTRGNRVINVSGFAISPTVKGGWILPVAPDLLTVMEVTTGSAPVTFPLSMQDITPYGNGVPHINSIMQPSTATSAPVVGVAICSAAAVPGSATGVTDEVAISRVSRFVVETALQFGAGACQFYDRSVLNDLMTRYGSMNKLQEAGRVVAK